MSIKHFQLSKETDEQIAEYQLGKDGLTVSDIWLETHTVAAVAYQRFFRQSLSKRAQNTDS